VGGLGDDLVTADQGRDRPVGGFGGPTARVFAKRDLSASSNLGALNQVMAEQQLSRDSASRNEVVESLTSTKNDLTDVCESREGISDVALGMFCRRQRWNPTIYREV
jgi:hypothetical protein